MPYLVDIYGPKFSRVVLASTRRDAENVRTYWRKRGMSVDIEQIATRSR